MAVVFTLALGACTGNQQREEGVNSNTGDAQSTEMEENNQNDMGGGGFEETDTTGQRQSEGQQGQGEPGFGETQDQEGQNMDQEGEAQDPNY